MPLKTAATMKTRVRHIGALLSAIMMLIFMSHNSLEFKCASCLFQIHHSHTKPKEANNESKSPVPTDPSLSTSLGHAEAHASYSQEPSSDRAKIWKLFASGSMHPSKEHVPLSMVAYDK